MQPCYCHNDDDYRVSFSFRFSDLQLVSIYSTRIANSDATETTTTAAAAATTTAAPVVVATTTSAAAPAATTTTAAASTGGNLQTFTGARKWTQLLDGIMA